MKQTLTLILLLFFIGTTGFLYICNVSKTRTIKKLEGTLPKEILKTDTIYLASSLHPHNPFKTAVNPDRVIGYSSFEVNIPSQSFSTTSKVPNFETLNIDSVSQSPLPYTDSIISFQISDNNLSLAIKRDSLYFKDLYHLDFNRYDYTWVNGSLTSKKRGLKLKPYIEAKYRPLNQMFDTSGGYLLETTSCKYKVGVNLFYYPNLSDKFGKDIEITFTKTF